MINTTLETPVALQKKFCRECKTEKLRLDFSNQKIHQCRECVKARRRKSAIKIVDSDLNWRKGYCMQRKLEMDLV